MFEDLAEFLITTGLALFIAGFIVALVGGAFGFISILIDKFF